MVDEADKDGSAEPGAEDLAPWQRNRKLRQAELERANAHGQQLLERYGYEAPRPRFAAVRFAEAKRRRRR